MAYPPAIPEKFALTYQKTIVPCTLIQVLDDLSERFDVLGDRKSFAQSLVMSYNKKNHLSGLQEMWARWLLAKARGLTDAEAKVEVAQAALPGVVTNHDLVQPDFSGLEKVVGMFDVAKTKLKWPKFNILDSQGKVLTLKLAGQKSKYPNGVHVTAPKKGGMWYGTIAAEGVWHPSMSAKYVPGLYQTLVDLATKPQAMAKAYSTKFGSCCFCHKTLTDAHSVKLGYGPICAGHYNLPY